MRTHKTSKRNIVVIGASAGGLRALEQLVQELPKDLDAAVFILLHSSPSAPSVLAAILQRNTEIPVHEAKDGDRIEAGTIVVAKPDYHLILEEHAVRLTRGPRENRSRPAIDALFRSAAYSHSSRVIGIVLTGALDDGTAGLWSIRDRGGLAIVQDPEDATFPSMPTSALKHAGADHVVRLDEIGGLLSHLTAETVLSHDKPASRELEIEIAIAKEGRGLQAGVMTLGEITPYTCPECAGVLVKLKEGGVSRFRCHTGHGYSVNTLLAEVTEHVEGALWGAIRSIEESAMLLDQIASDLRSGAKDAGDAELFEQKAKDTQRRADLVRTAVMEHQTLSVDNIADVHRTKR